MKKTKSVDSIIVALILSLALIISVLIFTFFYNPHNGSGGGNDRKNTLISVTGTSEKIFPADYIIIKGTINKNKEAFLNELLNKDFSREDITFNDSTFTIKSEFVKVVEDIAYNKSKREALGLSFGQPTYYLRNLDDIKLQMLAAATKKAKEKASVIITNGNGVIGTIIQSDNGDISYSNVNDSIQYLKASELNPLEKRKKVKASINQIYSVK